MVLTGDVIQIGPTCKVEAFVGCLATVYDVWTWGVCCSVMVPGRHPSPAPTRIEFGEFERVGQAVWVLSNEFDGRDDENPWIRTGK